MVRIYPREKKILLNQPSSFHGRNLWSRTIARKSRTKRRGAGLKPGPNPIVRDRGRLLLSLTASAGAVQIDVSTNTTTGFCQYGNKLLNMSDNYSLFRFTKLLVEVSPGTEVTTTGRYYVGYSPEVTNGAPANAGAMIELPWSMPIFFTASATNPNTCTQVVRKRIPRQMLTGQLVKWFHTRTGTFATDLVNQGTLFFMTPGTTDALFVVVEYEIEFKDWCQTGLTPLQVEHIRTMDSHVWKNVVEQEKPTKDSTLAELRASLVPALPPTR